MTFASYVAMAMRPHCLCRGQSPRCLHSGILGECRPAAHWILCFSFLTAPSFPSVEGLKDLLVGPGVELLLTSREPALPVETDSGGNTSPGVTASEYQGRGPR